MARLLDWPLRMAAERVIAALEDALPELEVLWDEWDREELIP